MASGISTSLRKTLPGIYSLCLRSQIAVRCLTQLDNAGTSGTGTLENIEKPKTEDQSSHDISKEDYKAKDYYSYDENSYFDFEVEMKKFRLPQPEAH